MRKYYLDNIRAGTVLLVVLYHVLYVFNAAGVPGGLGSFSHTQVQDAPLYFVYPWFMALLFLVAGVCARYALERKTAKAFLRERTQKLLVPSTLGLFVFQWMGGYLNVTAADGWAQMPEMPAVGKYLLCAVSGIGPLWFAQMLWLFSLTLPLWHKCERLYALCGKAKLPVLLLLVLPVWGASQVGNVPVLTVYRFGIYYVAFLLGYFVLSHDKVQEVLKESAIPLCAVSVAVGIGYTWYYFGKDYTSPACLQSFFTAAYLWLAVLAILGMAGRFADREWKCSRLSFGVYVLHYPVLVVLAMLCKNVLALPAAVCYIVPAVLTVPLTVGLYKILGAVPFVRFCVLGMRRRKTDEISTGNLPGQG